MPQTPPTPLMTAWADFPGPYSSDPHKIQATIYYCASRFRAASIAIVQTADEAAQTNMVDCLDVEVVRMIPAPLAPLTHFQMFCLQYLGMAAAIGYPVDIPWLIRVFACNAYQNGRDLLSLLRDRDFLQVLDAGPSEDELAPRPDSYALAWWTSAEAAEAASEADVLCLSTVKHCLEDYQNQTNWDGVNPAPTAKTKYTWSRDLSFKPEGVKLDCKRCYLYRAAALGVVDDLLGMRHHAHGLEANSRNLSHLTERRAAGFHQLHEAAILKEQQGGPNYINRGFMDSDRTLPVVAAHLTPSQTPAPSEIKSKQIEVRERAKADLTRLQQPPGVHWTWGTALSTQDVLALVPPQAPRGSVHSGYVESLPLGTSETSSVASGLWPSDSGEYSDVGQDVFEIPELAPTAYPHHFTVHPLRHYHGEPDPAICDPFGPVSRLPISVLAPPAADYMSYMPRPTPPASVSGE
jgi:hypothetical protein